MSTFGIYRMGWLMVRTSRSFNTLRKKPLRQYTQQRQRDAPLARGCGMWVRSEGLRWNGYMRLLGRGIR